ncbi:multidrug efflux MFS transporter [Flavimobilis sp. GY10621]|uniref:Multidrug efflux MFS transporter n=1 Tax=Flavimobilis rhizosphaerae TaxID=2775421 RepID=A0ABR9DRA1_9MICO|nr:DHA2 family efflux MFS transporter permease subunit [Flavimobilis rhizosphaerae]MBD9699489.1 multidrug efflux MFS transporter [Flavimobilis rhizosphaerae]
MRSTPSTPHDEADAPATSLDGPATTPGAARAAETPRSQGVIWLLLAAAFVVILNETIMGVAIPHLMTDLSIDAVAAQWLTTAFMLTMAVVIPVTGYLLERFTTRTLFIAAMSLFSTGTLVAAVSLGFPMLLGARVVQASGTAIMMPLLMTTIMTLVEPEHRGRLMGRISIVMSVAPAVGPTISGLILKYLTWRWMFILVLPIALVMLAIGARHVTNVGETRKAPLDPVSVVLAALGFGGLVFGLSLVGGEGGGDTAAANAAHGRTMLVALAVGAVALVTFVARQVLRQRTDSALLDLRTFRSRNFSVSIALMTVLMAVLFGTIILLPLFMQRALGLDTLASGLVLLPGSLLMGLCGPLVGRLYDKLGPRPLVVPGVMIVSGVLWGLTQVSETTPTAMLVVAHVTLSLGLALTFTPLFTSSLGSVEPRLYSHGSATLGTVQQVAGAIGTAVFVTLMASGAATLVAAGVPEAAATAAGVRDAFLVGAIVSLGAVVLSFFVTRPDGEGPGGGVGH